MSGLCPLGQGIQDWLKGGKYLPPILRDFHDQKEVFKTIHARINVEGHEYAAKVDWVAGQCYVIDIFLWFMAKRGYTLQRSRQRLDFDDLQADIHARKEQDSAAFAQMFEARKAL